MPCDEHVVCPRIVTLTFEAFALVVGADDGQKPFRNLPKGFGWRASIDFLWAPGFFEDSGDAVAGRRVFADKRCDTC